MPVVIFGDNGVPVYFLNHSNIDDMIFFFTINKTDFMLLLRNTSRGNAYFPARCTESASHSPLNEFSLIC